MDWLIWSLAFSPVLLVGPMWFFTRRHAKPERPYYGIWVPEASKGALTARQRSDLYQDMDWWDREFRKLSGEPEPLEVDGFVGSMAYRAQEVQNRLSNFGTAPKDLVELNQLNASGVLTTQEYIKHIKDKLEID